MTLLTAQPLATAVTRTYNVEVPATPLQATVPGHRGLPRRRSGRRRHRPPMGRPPPAAVPGSVADYLLVFPETHPQLDKEWVHFQTGNSAFPPSTWTSCRTCSATCHPRLRHRIGDRADGVRRPEPVVCRRILQWRRHGLAAAQLRPGGPIPGLRRRRQGPRSGEGTALPPALAHQGRARAGTGVLRPRHGRSGLPTPVHAAGGRPRQDAAGLHPPGDARPQCGGCRARRHPLVPGSTGVTEVVLQEFAGTAAYVHGTVLNGGHNWPTPTTLGNPPVATHFDATQAIVDFWRTNAGLP